MATRPSVYPDWAVDTNGDDYNIQDPSTGQNNVVVPDAGKKLIGWEYNEKPTRQYFNWLHRLTTQWLRYLDTRDVFNAMITVPVKITTGYLTVEQTSNRGYIRNGRTVVGFLPQMSGTSNSTQLRLDFATAATIPLPLPGVIYMTMMVQDNGVQIPGAVSLDTSSIYFYALSAGVYSLSGFTNSGVKGIPTTSFAYIAL